MLTTLSIRDVVLVDALDLEVGEGLTVLTGDGLWVKVKVTALEAALIPTSLPDVAAAIINNDFVQDAGLTEDRAAACAIQQGLSSKANTHFTFGHYEQAIGHFHRHLTEHVARLGVARERQDIE